jgi:endoribonuclease LACTB2
VKTDQRLAAAVILTRGDGADLEVFLAERSKDLRYFGGMFAFPGGVANGGDAGEPARTTRRCAIRELFEETGVLLGAPPELDRAALDTLRRALLDAERSKSDCPDWSALEARIEAAATRTLSEVCRILTPPFAPVRFDTVFFRATLPTNQTPAIWTGELVGGEFVKPREALARWVRGELRLAPPVLILLELLAAVGLENFDATAHELTAAFAAGLLPPVRFSPGIILCPLRTPTLPPATTTNTYVIGNERIFIVDPGTPEPDEMERLLALLAELEESGRELGGILLTHHHPDHVGGLERLARETTLPVFAQRATFERLPVPLDKKDRFERRELDDGATIDLGVAPDGSPNWTLTALHTPGHARGHLVFHESRYGAAVVGDMISTVSTIVIDPPEGHLATYLASLRRLGELPLSVLYPAHGPAVYDGRRVVTHYLKHRQEREDKLVAALRGGRSNLEALLPVVYSDISPTLFAVAARSLAAGVDKLIEDGRVERIGDEFALVP